MKKLRIAAYCRMANLDQLALECQRGCLENYASAQGYEVIEVVSDVCSGASLERPGIRRLCELVDSGTVDTVLATCMSRYARNTVELVGFIRGMKDKGVEVLTASHGSLSGAFEKLILMCLVYHVH